MYMQLYSSQDHVEYYMYVHLARSLLEAMYCYIVYQDNVQYDSKLHKNTQQPTRHRRSCRIQEDFHRFYIPPYIPFPLVQAEEAEKERQAQEFEKQREREALALAILNGTADKLELEKREREENE